MIVVITDEAERDLETIGDNIAKDSPLRAISFVRELRERCEGLVDMPYAFPLVPRYESCGIRRRVHGNYLIFYQAFREMIVVTHVLHDAMDYFPILFPS